MRGPSGLLDTIVAQATPPGLGAVALLRLSGAEAVRIVGALTGRSPDSFVDRTAHLCTVRWPGTIDEVDRCLVTVFRAPASYTGEDVVEVSSHGGYQIPATLVEACVAAGARHAAPGEFTQRAYLNGKLDLTQAEAVSDLITARSEKGRSVALHQLDRGLGDRIAELRSRLIHLSALLVQHIDFPEEDDAPTPLESIATAGETLRGEIGRLLDTAPAGELLREGALAVLAGRPNAGKSSLFNALIGTERAIVTEAAGTTRDALEAVISVEGFPFRLVDTAGLRTGAEGVEKLGIEVARRYLAAADVVIYCVDLDEGEAPADREFLGSVGVPVLRVGTKVDAAGGAGVAGDVGLAVSAHTGRGLGALRDELRRLVFREVVEDRDQVPVVTSRRQADLLRRAASEVGGFVEALGAGVPPEVASAHLKAAESAMEGVLGVVAADDVLDRVFRDFCIGK